jgi:hypothetical protein
MESSGSGFVETLANGTWSETPVILPSNATVPNDVFINSPHTDSSISCVAGTCAFGGSYATGTSQTDREGFINTYSSLTGYQLVGSDGGIFAFNAPFYGSMVNQHLNRPIVGVAYDSTTGGYYEVASDGGIFAFHAPFQGSTGGMSLNKPVVGMTVDTATGGYYEVASDGGIFAYGAPFQGSTGGMTLNNPIVAMDFG